MQWHKLQKHAFRQTKAFKILPTIYSLTSTLTNSFMKKIRQVLLLCLLALTVSVMAQTGPYTWKNVQIVGGGFVPGIIYSESQPGLVYARTDIGGAYRLDPATNKWIPLTDWINWDQWGYTGIVSLATDPVDPNRLYLAAGTYTNSWDPNNGAILRSTDKGNTFQITPLPFKLGGNMPGRGMGERLVVDPNKNSVLYLGAPSGNGLWRSIDYGATWAKVNSFPTAGTYAEDPTDVNGYLNDLQGIVWITFDKRSGTAGNTTQVIYVGVADKGNSVFRSTDGGATWSAVPGQPVGYIPHKGKLDTVNGFLFIAYSDTGGPYTGAKGEVWRLNTSTGVWTNISPIVASSSDNFFGYSGLALDKQSPGTLMVTGYSAWWPDTQIWRSKDNGTTWTRIWDWTRYPNRSFRYTHDITAAPWLYWGGIPTGGRPGAEVSPKLGWMTESLEIDPFNSNKMMYGTGATIYGTDNLTTWDSGGKIAITVKAVGLEETAIQELVSPPVGPQLLSGMYDIYGFTHQSVDVVPNAFFEGPRIATVSIDYAELSPSYMFRVGDGDIANSLKAAGYSTNGGTSWTPVLAQPTGVDNGTGTCAVSANGTRVVWSPVDAGVHYTTNNGKSWIASTGVPAGALVESDRVNANKFYAFKSGTFYVSTNGGTSFTAAATGLPDLQFKAVPGKEGHIWATAGASGMLRSVNSGATFTTVTNVTEADNVGFGKAATGQTYMAIYTSAKIGGIRGIFRSDNEGVTWVRINDDAHQYGWTGKVITGDPRIYGRVYIGTNGRGIIYGDVNAAAASSATAMLGADASALTISPNPIDGQELRFNLKGEKDNTMQLVVTDFNGNILYRQQIAGKDFREDVMAVKLRQKLLSGVYFLQIQSDNQFYSARFVVK
jgi:xyloglucan-specific exo-beta-1,4-glucanase